MTKNLLPPLNDDHQVPEISIEGEWTEETNSILARISNGLKSAKLEQDSEELVSVPDVWARTAVVANALYDERHPLHNQIKSEWRGLLALFALMPYHKQTIETEVINLNNLSSDPYKTKGEKLQSGNFAEVLAAITPSKKLINSQNWNEYGLIKINKKVIGLLVPSTIICPARYYGKSIDNSIPWFQVGKLIDPCLAADIRSEEFSVLINFIEQFEQGLAKESMSNQEYFDGILGALTSFKDDAEKRIRESGQAKINLHGFKRVNTSFKLPNQPGYSMLSNISEFDAGGSHAFDTFMKMRDGISEYKGAILVDEEMPNVIAKQASDIRVWDTYSLDKLSKNKTLRKDVEKEINKEKMLYITPEDIFTKSLCLLPQGDDKIIEHESYLENEYLYPLNPIILCFVTPENLRSRFEIKQAQNTYQVSLRIDIQDHLGEKKEYVLRKEYLEEEVINKFNQPTACSVWPNFSHPSWDRYYLYLASNLQSSISVNHTFSLQSLNNLIDQQETDKKRLDTFSRLSGKNLKFSKKLELGGESTVINELHIMQDPPEAIVCDAVLEKDVRYYVPADQRSIVGLIMLPKVKKAVVTNDRYKIGIDFGTTNTCAYIRKNDEEAKDITLSDRIFSPFEKSSSDEFYIRTLREFIPQRPVDVPFMTISRDRRIGLNQGDVSYPIPIWTAFIYFVNDMRDGLEDIEDPNDRELHFNLKWSKSPEDRQRIEIYLGQVVQQAYAEALAQGANSEQIQWFFSYPEAFTPDQLRSFKLLFKSSVEKGVDPFNVQENPNQIGFKSESLSSALYFASNKDAAFTDTAITIDIGGHTSDISIWQSRELKWRNSTQIAGRHILINFLCENIELIKHLSISDPVLQDAYAQLESIKNKGDKIEVRNAVEIIVNSKEFADAYANRFHIVDGQNEGMNLRTTAEIALAGILFYTGQIISDLNSKKIFDKNRTGTTTVCLGGRASLLYKVIFNDEEDQRALKDFLADASGGSLKSDQIKFSFTENPKHEVSHGLLVEEIGTTNLDLSKQSHTLILGEEIDCGGNTVKATSSIEELNIDEEWRILNLNNVRVFADKLKNNAGYVMDITRQLENKIVGNINGELVDTQERLLQSKKDGFDPFSEEYRGESTYVEPPFIVALRDLLERIVNKEVNVTSKRR
jgi:hypothetical protein